MQMTGSFLVLGLLSTFYACPPYGDRRAGLGASRTTGCHLRIYSPSPFVGLRTLIHSDASPGSSTRPARAAMTACRRYFAGSTPWAFAVSISV